MNALIRTTCVALLLTVCASVARAQQTYDIVDYFMLTPGLWREEEERKPGQPTSGRLATVVSKLGNFTLHNNFVWNGSGWVPDNTTVFEVKQNALLYHGDRHPITNDFVLFQPPISLPRSMQVGSSVSQVTTAFTPQGTQQVQFTAFLAADGVTQQTKARTYNNCLRLQMTFATDGAMDSIIDVRARQQGSVWNLEGNLDLGEPEATMAGAYIAERARP